MELSLNIKTLQCEEHITVWSATKRSINELQILVEFIGGRKPKKTQSESQYRNRVELNRIHI